MTNPWRRSGVCLIPSTPSTYYYRTAQAPGAFDHTQYAAANLVWTPDRFWIIGIEGLWGRRVDKDGADGSDFRTQITIQRNF